MLPKMNRFNILHPTLNIVKEKGLILMDNKDQNYLDSALANF